MAMRVEEGYQALNVSEGSVFEARVVRAPRAGRGRVLVAAALCALTVLAAVLLAAERDASRAGPPAARAVSEAATALRVGRAPPGATGAVAGSQALQGTPGVLAPPPPGGYNIFDPHYSQDGVPKSTHAGGTEDNVFTGHSHTGEGTPLSFGPNTYWNVFDPNGSPDLGPCDPGYTGTAGTATQKRDCHECGVGKWCPGGPDSVENDCPVKSTSFPGSFKAKQCTCIPGWYGVAHYHETKSCKMCLAGTYCPGGRKQFTCPVHSSSNDEAAYCTCDPGYFGVTHDDCQLCDANFYCPGGDPEGQQEYACPQNSLSVAGSDSGDDCQCAPAYYEPVPDSSTVGPDCVMCTANTYCPGGASNVDCPSNANSPVGSSVATACVCNPGYVGTAQTGCTRCPANSYCPGGTEQNACPANSASSAGSSKLSDCVCNAGFMGSSTLGCSTCPVDSYCPGGGEVYACTQYSHSEAGSVSCTCNEGFSPKADGTCFRCPGNFYCPAAQDYVPVQCPANTIAPTGSTEPHDCKCLPGFENTAYDLSSNWFKVSAGDFATVKARCESGGGLIASINSNREQLAAIQVCTTCWIGLQRDGKGQPWYNVDGHYVDFTAWALGKPDPGDETNVRYALGGDGHPYWDDYPNNFNFEGLCKKVAVPPTCTAIPTPMSLGMHTGFVTDFFYIGHHLDKFPADKVRDSVPNSEVIEDGIPFFNDHQFNKVDKNAPHDRLAGTWTGMLEIELPGTYTFSTKSDDGSHLYVDGTMVVNNGGLHGARLRTGVIVLSMGYHMVKAEWFENGGGANMVAEYKGPDTNGVFQNVEVLHFQRQQNNLPDPATLGMSRGWLMRLWFFNHGLSSFPAVDQNNVQKTLIVPEVKFDNEKWKTVGAPDDRFASVVTGMLPVYQSGSYEFWTASDDGSHLYIDGVPVVMNGGLHGVVKKRGTMRLTHGFHYIMVDFFENGGGAHLDITYKGPDTDNEEQPIDCFVPPGGLAAGVNHYGEDCWGGCSAKQGPCGWCGTGYCCRMGWHDTSGGCDGTIGMEGKGHVCSAPPPPPMIDEGPLAAVTLKKATGGNGPEMPKDKRGRNDKCAQFANQAHLKSKADQLSLMAKCMSQDCEQSMEKEVGCQYVTPGPGFCYTNPGQEFCKNNPSSPECVENFQAGGEWKPVKDFPFVGDKPKSNMDVSGTWSCVCAKKCSYQSSIRALRCADGYSFVGGRSGSPFGEARLDKSKGDDGIIKNQGKKKQCACACGKGGGSDKKEVEKHWKTT